NSGAATRPIPLPAPVITATLPSSRAINAPFGAGIGSQRVERADPISDRPVGRTRVSHLIGVLRRGWNTALRGASPVVRRVASPHRGLHVPSDHLVVVVAARRRLGARSLSRCG